MPQHSEVVKTLARELCAALDRHNLGVPDLFIPATSQQWGDELGILIVLHAAVTVHFLVSPLGTIVAQSGRTQCVLYCDGEWTIAGHEAMCSLGR